MVMGFHALRNVLISNKIRWINEINSKQYSRLCNFMNAFIVVLIFSGETTSPLIRVLRVHNITKKTNFSMIILTIVEIVWFKFFFKLSCFVTFFFIIKRYPKKFFFFALIDTKTISQINVPTKTFKILFYNLNMCTYIE